MTMTTGEFEFDSTFRQDGSELPNSPDIQFPFASYILWILFLILMPILFINLLVGDDVFRPHPLIPPIGWSCCR